MKKLRFYSVVFTFALLIIPMLQSCLNDDDENRGTRFTIGTIEVIGEKEYFFNLDDGDKMYPSDTTYIHNYTVENNQRVFIHFLPLEEDIPGYDYNVKLIQLENILTKDIIPLTEETADSIGNDRINATFRLDKIAKQLTGKKGLKIIVNTIYDGKQTYTIDLKK